MRGAIMIEKRCKIDMQHATYISVKCHICGGETSIPMQAQMNVENCGVCKEYFGSPTVAYINNLKKTHQLKDAEFDVSIVSIEKD